MTLTETCTCGAHLTITDNQRYLSIATSKEVALFRTAHTDCRTKATADPGWPRPSEVHVPDVPIKF